jgi:hypothetical protein
MASSTRAMYCAARRSDPQFAHATGHATRETASQQCGISFNDAIEHDDPRFEQMSETLRSIEESQANFGRY